jgi:hypothetical protein
MKKLFILLIAVCFSLSGFAKLDTKQVIGTWKYKVDTGDQILSGTLTFAEKENSLTVAVVTGEGDVFPVTKVETKPENVLYFEIKLENDLIKVTLKMEGDKFKGTGSNYQGEFVVTGEKQK